MCWSCERTHRGVGMLPTGHCGVGMCDGMGSTAIGRGARCAMELRERSAGREKHNERGKRERKCRVEDSRIGRVLLRRRKLEARSCSGGKWHQSSHPLSTYLVGSSSSGSGSVALAVYESGAIYPYSPPSPAPCNHSLIPPTTHHRTSGFLLLYIHISN